MTAQTEPAIDEIAVDHIRKGTRIRTVLRGLFVVFLILTVLFAPPDADLTATVAIVACYTVWAAVTGRLGWIDRTARAVRWIWPTLLVDAAVLTALTVIAGRSDATAWTTFILLNGFALLPLMAATQLDPTVCARVGVVSVVVYFAAAMVAQSTSTEPTSTIALHTFVIAVLALGSVLLSAVQRSRVETIEELARDRARLLDELVGVEDRERAQLAEALHDGALQYVLAARQELDSIECRRDEESLARVHTALSEATGLLRTTLASLHPAVLDEHGLGPALSDLGTAARSAAGGTGPSIVVDVVAWPDGVTPVDRVLYAAARELLSNALRHSSATTIEVTAEATDGEARVVVVDDGVGIGDAASGAARSARLAQGHLGLASRAIRLEVAGGSLRLRSRPGGGTAAIASVPLGATEVSGS
ncbi:ATPase [Gordonia spumicola]|uniref:ATPase n=1 Tax=Gordonia spumicola TaxID=589161 RepID=A0A7I9VCJ1_9ACTN|nr:ATP-binding protein [Gordonia spumicola]GEE02720.1 ATPase [Gordonia spumicola]